jgi:cyclopropane-fatty-acyl-phospholipid synthase
MNTATTTAPRFATPKDAPLAARNALRCWKTCATARSPHVPARWLAAPLWRAPQHHAMHTPKHPSASMTLRNWNVFGAALKSGDIGFAESYIAGDWTTPDLTELLKVFCANRQQVDAIIFGTWLGACCTASNTCCTTTAAPTAAKTSTPTTTWATRFTGCGWTRP